MNDLVKKSNSIKRPLKMKNSDSITKLPQGLSFKKIKKEKIIEQTDCHSPLNNNDQSTADAFEGMMIDEAILRGLHSIGIVKPTELQRKLLPTLINNQTDSIFFRSLPFQGKKMAILISLLQRINTAINAPQVIFLTCTNELTFELVDRSKQITKYTSIQVEGLVKNKYFHLVNQHLLIGPMGTILFLIRNKVLNVKELRCVYFDEADILFNSISNEANLHILTRYLKNSCQLIIQSSFDQDTLTENLFKSLRKKFLVLNYLKQDEYFKNTLHFHVICDQKDTKIRALLNVIRDSLFNRVLIYASGLSACHSIHCSILERTEYHHIMLTSELTLDERMDAIRKFRNYRDSNKMIMITNSPHVLTGLDMGKEAFLIINYDLYLIVDANRWYAYLNKIRLCLRYTSPGFVVNFSYIDQFSLAEQLEKYFDFKMIKLDALGESAV